MTKNNFVNYVKFGIKDVIVDILFSILIFILFFVFSFIISGISSIDIMFNFGNPIQFTRPTIIMFFISVIIGIVVKGYLISKIYKINK